ncbi:MAG TPA: tetraacyldisaccharide 4'-kinase [Xanthobacteraceae bacterium]|nr:tetraacyldisaccharide 4'-kinase [Xanthobacteraceae bacterium]
MTAPLPLRAPHFWWRKPGASAALLYPVSAIYGVIAARRLARPGYKPKIPVLCIGNPTLGGAGKTPTAIAVATYLKAQGRNPYFLTRGYGGKLKGPVLADLGKHDARAIGDEAPLLAAVAPTIIAQDRAAGAQLAEANGAGVLIMDDGFQNPSLEKNFALLVVDGAKGIGNGLPFPSGPLRAPLGAQLRRAEAVLVVGAGEAGERAAALASKTGLVVLRGRLAAQPEAAAQLSGMRVLAYAGIGAPEKFFRSLEEAGAVVAARRSFGDHHRYTAKDASSLLAQSVRTGLQLVTTEKDAARMHGDPALAGLLAESKQFRVRLAFDDEAPALTLIGKALEV